MHNPKTIIMNNLNIIFTTHREIGECNADALFKIIEIINPDVIFEELSYLNYDKVYNTKELITLETTSIKKYLTKNNIKHIPVDTYGFPENHYDKIGFMLDKLLFSSWLKESFELRSLIDKQSSIIDTKGFRFLNSDDNNKTFEEIDILKEILLNNINDDKLYEFAKLEKDVIEKREEEMLNNIYNFSDKHTYKQALFFIGSGHRKSIIDKIKRRNEQEDQKINWIFHNA